MQRISLNFVSINNSLVRNLMAIIRHILRKSEKKPESIAKKPQSLKTTTTNIFLALIRSKLSSCYLMFLVRKTILYFAPRGDKISLSPTRSLVSSSSSPSLHSRPIHPCRSIPKYYNIPHSVSCTKPDYFQMERHQNVYGVLAMKEGRKEKGV